MDFSSITSHVPSWFSTPDDIPSHPGFGDCVWQPGELIQFTSDTVIVGDSDLPSAEKTFSLKMYYPPEVINYTIDDLMSSAYSEIIDETLKNKIINKTGPRKRLTPLLGRRGRRKGQMLGSW